MKKNNEKKFCKLILEHGWLSSSQLKQHLHYKGDKSIDEWLLSKNILSVQTVQAIWDEIAQQKRFFGPYEVLEKMAQGAVGEIYKVRHKQLHQIYALKVLLAGGESSEGTVSRFIQEAQIIARLKHPGIVQIIDSGKIGKRHYFCMEFVEGETLESWMKGSSASLRKGLELFI
ncbi:MAG: protein kinase, partial [Planctomycetota bacterium]